MQLIRDLVNRTSSGPKKEGGGISHEGEKIKK
jgi:hypothetical protein